MNVAQQSSNGLRDILHDGLRRQQGAVSPGTDWLIPVRKRGAAAVEKMSLPTRKDESWRYTPLGFLDRADYRPLSDGPFAAIQPSDIDPLLLPGFDGVRLVFVNGYLAPALSDLDLPQAGVEVRALAGGLGEVSPATHARLDTIAEQRHVFSALNSALMSDGALIHIAGDVAANSPIEILHLSVAMDQPCVCHPRHLIVLDQGARAELVERYCSLGEAVYFNNAVVEVALGANSELQHARLQDEGRTAQHLSDLHIRLGAHSRYQLSLTALGGIWSRNDIRVTFDGEGAEAQLDGLMLAQDGQLNDVHVDVRHRVPHCTSRETFRSILDGKGRVVFDGRVLVARDAQKTDAQLTNDNLMLSRAAEVDTKPQLEIYADDVKCSHGTTVGELDEEMLFYLQSRGIPRRQAQQILCQGFAEQVLSSLSNTALHRHIGGRLAGRLVSEP